MLKFFILKALDKFIHFVVSNKTVCVYVFKLYKKENFDKNLAKFLYTTKTKLNIRRCLLKILISQETWWYQWHIIDKQ